MYVYIHTYTQRTGHVKLFNEGTKKQTHKTHIHSLHAYIHTGYGQCEALQRYWKSEANSQNTHIRIHIYIHTYRIWAM